MKVIINSKHGGFNLSDEAIRLCQSRGLEVAEGSKYFVEMPPEMAPYAGKKLSVNFLDAANERRLRSHPVIVGVVEELGERSWGPFACLKVIEIPFDNTDEWQIDDYDGMESVIPRVAQRWM